MLYGFAIIIGTMVAIAVVLGFGLVIGILYVFGIDNWGICYMTFTLLLKR